MTVTHAIVGLSKSQAVATQTTTALNEVFKGKHAFDTTEYENSPHPGFKIRLIVQPGTRYSVETMKRIDIAVRACFSMAYHIAKH